MGRSVPLFPGQLLVGLEWAWFGGCALFLGGRNEALAVLVPPPHRTVSKETFVKRSVVLTAVYLWVPSGAGAGTGSGTTGKSVLVPSFVRCPLRCICVHPKVATVLGLLLPPRLDFLASIPM